MDAVTKGMLVGEVVKRFPQSIGIMQSHGMECIGCHIATWETLEQGAQAHGIDVDRMVKAINNKIEVEHR